MSAPATACKHEWITWSARATGVVIVVCAECWVPMERVRCEPCQTRLKDDRQRPPCRCTWRAKP